MSQFPILKDGRVADLTALIRHLATCKEVQRDTEVLQKAIRPTSPTKEIVVEHPDLFRLGGEKSVAVSLLVRFLIPNRPPLDEEQIKAIIDAVNRCHQQALEQSRHNLDQSRYNLEWWQWLTSFLFGGAVGAILLEVVRHFFFRA